MGKPQAPAFARRLEFLTTWRIHLAGADLLELSNVLLRWPVPRLYRTKLHGYTPTLIFIIM